MRAFYRHFRNGNVYEVICEAHHHETQKVFVVYRSLKTGQTWIREKDDFFEQVQKELTDKSAYHGPRFIKLQSADHQQCKECQRFETIVTEGTADKFVYVCTGCSTRWEEKL